MSKVSQRQLHTKRRKLQRGVVTLSRVKRKLPCREDRRFWDSESRLTYQYLAIRAPAWLNCLCGTPWPLTLDRHLRLGGSDKFRLGGAIDKQRFCHVLRVHLTSCGVAEPVL